MTIHGDKALSVIKKYRFAVKIKSPQGNLPGPGATIGVPVGAAISRPLWASRHIVEKSAMSVQACFAPSNGIIKPVINRFVA